MRSDRQNGRGRPFYERCNSAFEAKNQRVAIIGQHMAGHSKSDLTERKAAA